MPTSPEDELDADLLDLIDKGLLNMGYDEVRGDWVFWLTDAGNSVATSLEKEIDESSGNH